jgi:ribosomal-protein-alanine N-acetyltransferase
MDYIETDRLILRNFTEKDLDALFAILSDKEVNTFLPMFPLKNMEEAREYLLYIEKHIRQKGLYYAICLKENNTPIGCIHVSADDSHDLGYSIGRDFWHKGICTEACRAVVDMLRQTDIPYITATHDVNNPRSGDVMRAIGMVYKYSYEELWQPKNFPVTFRMYQLNLDGDENRVYKKYWDRYSTHFIEDIPH